MTDISVIGAGAFGTALAISLARAGQKVSLVARTQAHADEINTARENRARLPGIPLPDGVTVTANPPELAQTCLLAVPAQSLGQVVTRNSAALEGKDAVACCKGLDIKTGLGPTQTIARNCKAACAAILSGPGFAQDIAAGLPTAMTIATRRAADSERLQHRLSTGNLRLYRSTDVIGVEMGGALKNVVAIGAGITIGAGLGESARAALVTRGFAEMQRFAEAHGARPQTLAGLSGLGDLILTCTSELSRNFRHGLHLGSGRDAETGTTIEGVATALAVAKLAQEQGLGLPLTQAVASLLSGDITVAQAVDALLARPLRKE